MIRAIDKWLPAYLGRDRAPPPPAGGIDLIVAVCDHFEPFHNTDKEGALRRLREWADRFPSMVEAFSDHDGVGPRHTFFYPVEQYDADVVEEIAALCRTTGGEAEVHLHHDGDTAETLRRQLDQGVTDLSRHGLLATGPGGGTVYGFIHGDWALDHSHPEGRHCGVPDELGVLRATGCYADFTMPSAPSPTQTRTINSIYYARNGPEPKSHDRGIPAAGGASSTEKLRDDENNLLLVQGPLGLNWSRRKWGVLPRLENGDLTGANPPTPDRLGLWSELGIHVGERPGWRFVKLHTHGAVERNSTMLLGEGMRRFHEALRDRWNDGERCRLHYVTARELVNLVHAAESGAEGEPGDLRDFLYQKRAG